MGLDLLAKGVASHDEKSFELVYQRLYKLVFLVCLSVVKDEATAQDLSQDTFVAVWNKSSEFRGKGYKAWILTIAKNKSINYIKKHSRIVPVGADYELDLACTEVQGSSEDSLALKMAIERLDPIDSQIVLLRAAGMKMNEIALLLNMPRGTVSWRYSEALKFLKKLMKGDKR